MQNILITGGAGFIGSNLSLKLLEKGYKITVLDSLSKQIHGKNPEKTSPLYQSIKGKVNFIKGSVTSRKDWLKALENQEAIVHLAAETGTGQSMYEIEKYVNTNIGGTALMLDILANTNHTIKRVLVAESRAIYGEGKYYCNQCGIVYPHNRNISEMSKGDYECHCPKCNGHIKSLSTTEDSEIQPSSVYGISKQVQGMLTHLVCQAIGIESVSFRYQNVYGPGQSLSNPYTGILSIFSTRIKNHNPINIFEDGKESRDFIYIDDAVDATILGLESAKANGKVFNIGTGVAIDVLTVANTLCEKFGIKVPITISGNYRLGDIRHNYANITEAKNILGFSPKWSFTEGITKFCQWVDCQVINKDRYEESIDEMKKKGAL
ncbi:MAG: NAD-dependent epimerase/dehydratase family protein [Bacteroidales bacterium]|nr:NAD-dependent epimerase/dehydratase family protein [Bacteroidales bacterium]